MKKDMSLARRIRGESVYDLENKEAQERNFREGDNKFFSLPYSTNPKLMEGLRKDIGKR